MDTDMVLIFVMFSVLLSMCDNNSVYGAQAGFLINTTDTGTVSVNSGTGNIHRYYENLNNHGVDINSGDLVFEVKSCGEAFILLSDLGGNVIFELGIGCWSNKKVCINKYGQKQDKFNVGSILDCDQFKFFWLKWTVNGTVSFGTGNTVGTKQVFTEQTRKTLFGLGVRSGYGNTAVWRRVISTVATEQTTTSLPTTQTSTTILSTQLPNTSGSTQNPSTSLSTSLSPPTASGSTTIPSKQTTTELPTTSESTQNPSTSGSNCACSCTTSSTSQSTDETEPGPYKVEKKTLSSHKRKLTSASDPRKSSMYIGTVGVAVISSIVLFLIVLDCIPRNQKKKMSTKKSKQIKRKCKVGAMFSSDKPLPKQTDSGFRFSSK